MPPAELPFDRDVDRDHAERHRERQRRAERRAVIKNELRRGAGIVAGRRGANDAPLTERVAVTTTVSEMERIQRLADELGVSVPTLLRGCALVFERRLEGRL